ncbi:thiolase C-terminal domain-containing protein [Nocardia salmonicida]|uniref:Thiolase family protein n=1 Tax=Nocardia salmonicida TaxID=53431 RepID=A0ABZ1N2U7_9NOCA|nr:beta-ketoacyl synthase N-terminal-like domain-containing protein [Nocardia salmonicida]
MRRVAIVGAGMTPFAEHFALGIKDLVPMAFADCARSIDKGLRKSDIQAAWFGELGTADGFASGILADTLGLPDIPVTRVENACATGHDAVRNALLGIASGAIDVALVVGADKLRESASKDMLWEWEAMTRDMAWDYPLGLVAPAGFALHVARYLHESPATREHMAMVAVKNHKHGVRNLKARLRFEISIEEALAAPTVVTPFGLYDCAPQSDGAAALVLAAEDVVDRYTDRPVWIRGVGLGMDSVMHQHKRDMTTFPATVRAAKQAFGMAGLTPSDIDVAEVHDFFTGIELMSYEDLGFADRFEAHKLVEAGVTSVGGALPVNPSGGLKSKGHPPGATGVAQCVELFEQLRGDAVNQVDRARIGLAHSIGGPTAVAAVTILAGPDTRGASQP